MTIVSFTLPNFEKYCSNPLSSVFHDNPPTKIFVPFVTRAGDAAADCAVGDTTLLRRDARLAERYDEGVLAPPSSNRLPESWRSKRYPPLLELPPLEIRRNRRPLAAPPMCSCRPPGPTLPRPCDRDVPLPEDRRGKRVPSNEPPAGLDGGVPPPPLAAAVVVTMLAGLRLATTAGAERMDAWGEVSPTAPRRSAVEASPEDAAAAEPSRVGGTAGDVGVVDDADDADGDADATLDWANNPAR